ncbi:MAG: hypothetical protein GC179_05605 [Anaerolineaceae bacterium]|nr:hypothetical protein [Anaerolineaceae bacterium]
MMRKLVAVSILLVIYLPLAFAAMTLISIRPWILDRGFYERLVGDERLYETLWTDDLSAQFDQKVFTTVEQLPLDALSIALREVATPDYLRTQATKVVNDVFDFIEGREQNFQVMLDISPLKADLVGEKGKVFATALAAALPNCEIGQSSIAVGGRLTRCIAPGVSVDEAANQITAALPAALEASPDTIVIGNRGYLRTNWYDYAWLLGSGVHAVLDVSILLIIVTAAGAAFVGSILGGDDMRGRLRWYSAALFVPGGLAVLAGLILVSPAVIVSISSVPSGWFAVQHSTAYREAIAQLVVPVVQQVGGSFLLTGIVVSAIALILLMWSWAASSVRRENPKMVQIPLPNS